MAQGLQQNYQIDNYFHRPLTQAPLRTGRRSIEYLVSHREHSPALSPVHKTPSAFFSNIYYIKNDFK